MLPSSEADRGGLTAANTVARQRHTAVVFDSKLYRNAGSNAHAYGSDLGP